MLLTTSTEQSRDGASWLIPTGIVISRSDKTIAACGEELETLLAEQFPETGDEADQPADEPEGARNN